MQLPVADDPSEFRPSSRRFAGLKIQRTLEKGIGLPLGYFLPGFIARMTRWAVKEISKQRPLRRAHKGSPQFYPLADQRGQWRFRVFIYAMTVFARPGIGRNRATSNGIRFMPSGQERNLCNGFALASNIRLDLSFTRGSSDRLSKIDLSSDKLQATLSHLLTSTRLKPRSRQRIEIANSEKIRWVQVFRPLVSNLFRDSQRVAR